MRIYIGTPTASTIHSKTMASLISLQSVLMVKGYTCLIDCTISNTIHFIRNTMAWRALERQCDILLFIDSDVFFEPKDILMLIESDKDISTLTYRYKKPNEAYCCNILSDENGYPVVKDGWVELEKAGTGIMCIRRRVLEKLKETLKDRYYLTKDGDERIAFFEYILEDQRYHGEDYYFCKRAKDAGFSIWLWPDAVTGHVGISEYVGNIHYFLQNTNHVSKLDYIEPEPAIDGWMTRLELNCLYKIAQRAESFVEIGCWKGKATHAICSGCKGKVYSIDHFMGTPGEHEVLEDEVFEAFKKNTNQFDNLTVYRMSSKDGAKQVGEVDVVFIDANHSYESVREDIELWDPKAKKLIAGHDYDRVGVKAAVDQKYGNKVRVLDSIWMVIKDEEWAKV